MKATPISAKLSVVLLSTCFVGCEAMKSGAPAVNPEMVRAAAANGDSVETLSAGRRLLAMRCTGCHGLEPVAAYTSVEWRANVRSMAGRAKLSGEEEREITAYLVAARESL